MPYLPASYPERHTFPPLLTHPPAPAPLHSPLSTLLPVVSLRSSHRLMAHPHLVPALSCRRLSLYLRPPLVAEQRFSSRLHNVVRTLCRDARTLPTHCLPLLTVLIIKSTYCPSFFSPSLFFFFPCLTPFPLSHERLSHLSIRPPAHHHLREPVTLLAHILHPHPHLPHKRCPSFLPHRHSPSALQPTAIFENPSLCPVMLRTPIQGCQMSDDAVPSYHPVISVPQCPLITM